MSGHLTEDISDLKCHMRSYRLNQIAWVLTDSSHYTKVKLQSEPDDLCDCLREFLNTRKQIKSRYLSSDIVCFWKALVFGQRFQRFYAAFQSPSARVLKESWLLAFLGVTESAQRGLCCAELQVCGAFSQFAMKSVGSGCSPASAPISLTQQEPRKSPTTGTTATRYWEEHVLSWF